MNDQEHDRNYRTSIEFRKQLFGAKEDPLAERPQLSVEVPQEDLFQPTLMLHTRKI